MIDSLRWQVGLQQRLTLPQWGTSRYKEFSEDGAIAKWLRRLIRNQLLFEGAGSSPAGVANAASTIAGLAQIVLGRVYFMFIFPSPHDAQRAKYNMLCRYS
jgi:hypothetical protein